LSRIGRYEQGLNPVYAIDGESYNWRRLLGHFLMHGEVEELVSGGLSAIAARNDTARHKSYAPGCE